MLLSALIEGISGRDLWFFVTMSILENGTILAVFSALVTSILEDHKGDDNLDSAICTDPVTCPL